MNIPPLGVAHSGHVRPTRYGNDSYIAIEYCHRNRGFFPFNMVIFRRYVSLPEGNVGCEIWENVGSEDIGIFDGALSYGGATGESHFHLLAYAAVPRPRAK